jgi:Uncharacterized distant relative of homeotic protein bithoraxoid
MPPAAPPMQPPVAPAPNQAPAFGMGSPAGFGAPPAPDAGFQMPAPPAPPPAPVPAPAPAPGGLFQVDDGDMDRLFSGVMIDPAKDTNTAVRPPQAQPPAPQMPQMPQQAPQMPQQPAMPAMPQMAPPQMAAPQMPPQPPAIAHIPPSVPPPKIEGIGKLDANVDTNDTGSGRIAAIGKFLLDQKDLEKLGKITSADQSDVKMRILTLEASEDLQMLLSEIGNQEAVIGSVIVGHDGLLIANTMPEEVDAESIGVWALGVYMNTEHVIKKMGHDRVHQVVSRTPRGYVVIADFGGGLLVCITDGTETDSLIPLMRKITDLVS